MKDIKQKKAARLFRAIGEIDDALLQEASTYRPALRTGLSRVWLIAATLSLSIILLFSTVTVMLKGFDKSKPPSQDEPDGFAASLDQVLLDRREGIYTTLSSSSELPYFDGNVYLVWQYADGDALYMSRALTQDEIGQLRRNMGKGTKVGAMSPEINCRIWIICGNGEVYSPYLLASAGNIGSAELFDYEAELIPSEKLIYYISGMLD